MTALDTIKITKINEVFIHIAADRGILRELSERFAFFAKNYQHLPVYKNTNWDGKIRVFDTKNNLIYAGLLEEVKAFAAAQDYKIDMDYADFAETELSRGEAIDFINKIIQEVKIPDFEQEIREYQLLSFLSMVRSNRKLMLSPTSSGKSFMIYLLQRYYNLPTLIIVDSTAAVQQMADDLESYGYDVNNIHMIYGGQDKTILKPVVISTWQSIAKSNADYLCKFGVIVGDEAHHFQAKTFKEFMEKATEAKYRFGFTGTIDDTESECNEMILTGLFGPVEKFITTAELMDQGYVTPLKIKSIVLQYNNNTKKTVYKIVDKRKKIDYNDEMKFIESYVKRNNFIKNLVCDLKGNTLLFFQHKEHGELLYSMIREELAKRGLPVTNVHISHGEIAGKKRNDLRGIFEKNTGQIGVVSYGTFQTSISIKNVHNMVFGSPSKSLIRVLQSIGRGLRLHESKEYVTLFDLADNLMLGNSKNHTIKHFKVRMQIYAKENFKVKIYNVKLEDE